MPDCEVLPGVEASLAGTRSRCREVGIGLLTGNFERGAAIKLGHFDLWQRFGFGAFGDVHADRRQLVPIAISRSGTRDRRLDSVVARRRDWRHAARRRLRSRARRGGGRGGDRALFSRGVRRVRSRIWCSKRWKI